MAVTIAGIYEIEKNIGSGGGGIVYLGRHTRLDKQIVLKADKRKLSAGTETLRREVDLLKGLSHTYIPQVYDFVQEGDKVYTIMDYVEGTSLDKVLASGQPIPQKDIVKWACQLLEALSYLHNQKPHGILHGDMKPANIMLRPDGDICLIDFNIALALGEDGAVKVGFSRGYASPEHYGSAGALANPLAGTQGNVSNSAAKTAADHVGNTEQVNHPASRQASSQPPSRSTASRTSDSQKRILLDARSDIYGLGATLYHLLSGRRPAQNAAEVVPLTGCCSPQIAAIIKKSMEPDREKRYQSAEEMLDAFLHLRANDSRVKKNRRRFLGFTAASILLFLVGGAGTFIGMKQAENYETALKMASYSQASLADGDTAAAVKQAMQALETGDGVFRADAPAEAQKALADALGVYELSDGFKADGKVELAAAPFDLTVSPEGTRFAVSYAYEAAVFSADGSGPVAVRGLKKSAFSDCLFLDEDTVLYAGGQGVEAYSLATGSVLWTGEPAAYLALSGDRSVAAAVDPQADYAVLYNTADGKKLAECPFAGRHIKEGANDIYADRADYILELDKTGKWLAVSFSNGALSVFDTSDPDNELILYDKSDYDVFSGGFCGELFAYTAQGTGQNFFGVLDTKALELIGSKESRDKMIVQANENGICLSDGNLLARFAPDTLEETELAYTEGNTIQGYDVGSQFTMAVTDDHMVSFYDNGANLASQMAYGQENSFVKLADGYALVANREEPLVRILKLESHKESELFSYDTSYKHNEARVSADGEYLMLFGYEGFCTIGRDGKKAAEYQLPDAGQIYDQQFIRDGETSYLEVIWYDGTVRQYGMDGALLSEETRETPDAGLEEEFLTGQYRIVSRLHEAPQVYSRKNDKFLSELEPDAELTYVTQLDNGYLMTEYVDSALRRYGILLDGDLKKLAKLPDLCDVYGNTVAFDYQNGSIRACNIYSLEELAALGREYQ